MADLTPNDNPKPVSGSGGSPSLSGANGSSGKDGNGHFPGAHKPASRWQRHMGTTRRWARDTFNREQLVAGLKQLMWVAPLTLLIWVYAEREQQVPDTVRVTIEPHSSDPKIAVRLIDPLDGSVVMNISGARNRIDELHRMIESRSTPVRFEIPGDVSAGAAHLLEVKDAVQHDSRFQDVTVTGSQPSRVNVFVDKLEEQPIKVQLRPEDAAKFDQVVFSPSEVRVRVPAQALKNQLNGKLVVYADLSNLPDTTPGPKSDVRGIPLKLDRGDNLPNVSIEPSTVTVSLTVRAADTPLTIPSLPIREDVLTAARNAATLKLDVTTLFNVKIIGPPAIMGGINPLQPEKDVEALIKINPEDVRNGGVQKKDVWFRVPPGVRVESVNGQPVSEQQPLQIEVTFEKRGEVE